MLRLFGCRINWQNIFSFYLLALHIESNYFVAYKHEWQLLWTTPHINDLVWFTKTSIITVVRGAEKIAAVRQTLPHCGACAPQCAAWLLLAMLPVNRRKNNIAYDITTPVDKINI
jgi:hypothetical protein